jgi:uncharacterized protein (DUF433 family)
MPNQEGARRAGQGRVCGERSERTLDAPKRSRTMLRRSDTRNGLCLGRGLGGFVVCNLGPDLVPMRTHICPGIGQIFRRELAIRSQQFGVTGAQTPRLLQGPHRDSRAGDTRIVTGNAEDYVNALLDSARHGPISRRLSHREQATNARLPTNQTQVYPAVMPTPRVPAVQSHPEIMSGTVVFARTRVPFQTLIDYIEAGQPLSEFLEDFPTVSSEQAIAALEEAKEALLTLARPA